MINRKKIINYLGNFLVILSIIFMFIKIEQFNISFYNYFNINNIFILFIASLFLMLSVLFLSRGWLSILNSISNSKLDKHLVDNIYIKANIGKYIPGNIMQFVGRNVIASSYNIPQKYISLSIIYEIINLLFGGMIIVLFTNKLDIIRYFSKNFIIIIIFLIMIVISVVLNVMKKNIFHYIKNTFFVIKKSFIYYLVGLCFMGISFLITIKTLYTEDMTLTKMIGCISSFIIAWFIGFLTPGAPGGIGIREIVLTSYLGNTINQKYILQLVIVHRFINVLSDILLFILNEIIFNLFFKGGINNMSSIQPEGNYYDKYSSKNVIINKIMDGFFNSIDRCLDNINFSNVLEVGCGEGKITNYIYNRYNCDIQGFDIGEDAIRRAKNDYKNLNFTVKSIYDSNYKNNEFDLVVCCEVLEHLDDYNKALEEIFRISNDYVLVSVPQEPIWRVLNMCRGKYIPHLGNTPGHINHWSRKEFIKLVKKYGSIIKIETPLPWTMILLKK